VADWVNSEVWTELREKLGNCGFIRQIIKKGDQLTDCSVGIDDAAKLHLMIRVGDDSTQLPPDLNNIAIRYAETDCLVVDVAADASLEAIITPVYDQIIAGCLDGRSPVDVVSDSLDRIRRAFARAGSPIGENKQIGLVGELVVMRHIMIPSIGNKAAFQWSGPLAERHDFVGSNVHVEVKTTTRSIDQHEISRLDQLQAPQGKRLLLASVQLERSIAGEFSIATLREEILVSLAENASAQEEFERKLQGLGWYEGLVQTGTLLRFNLRSLSVFAASGSFPRLPDDYVPPRGVVGVTYTINISACPIMDANSVIRLVATM
jgi:hypothetical protein